MWPVPEENWSERAHDSVCCTDRLQMWFSLEEGWKFVFCLLSLLFFGLLFHLIDAIVVLGWKCLKSAFPYFFFDWANIKMWFITLSCSCSTSLCSHTKSLLNHNYTHILCVLSCFACCGMGMGTTLRSVRGATWQWEWYMIFHRCRYTM